SGNWVALGSGGPSWGNFAFSCFFKLSVDTNDYGVVAQLGAPGTYTNIHVILGPDSDGTTFQYYNDFSTDQVDILNLTVGRTYGLRCLNSGTDFTIYLQDTVTGTVTGPTTRT